jgi:hypothetical protein
MQVFRTCILTTPGGAIPKSGVARRGRPPPPRITLRIQPDPEEVVSPSTPHGNLEGGSGSWPDPDGRRQPGKRI